MTSHSELKNLATDHADELKFFNSRLQSVLTLKNNSDHQIRSRKREMDYYKNPLSKRNRGLHRHDRGLRHIVK